jgi:hypothetical protein
MLSTRKTIRFIRIGAKNKTTASIVSAAERSRRSVSAMLHQMNGRAITSNVRK